MSTARMAPFGGMVPAVDDTLLQSTNSSLAKNTWLYQGSVWGLPTPKLIHTNADATITKVYRIPNNYTDPVHFSDSLWLEFSNLDTDVIRSVVIDDQFDRYYWASSSSAPRYNTLERIAAGNTGANAPFLLGIPQPGTPTLVITSGGSSTQRSTAYVTTYVSAYGEEGPVSNPVDGTGKVDAIWTLTLPAPAAGDLGTDRNLTNVRIYRTVTGTDGTTTFFFVAELPIATTTYADSASDATVSLNEILSSTTWSGPPDDLQGWVTLTNGMIAGWRQNELWFCEPFRPHAWPARYTVTTEYPIVALGVLGQTLVVTTQGIIYTATGVDPSSISLVKLPGILPCTSRGSVVSAPDGVYFSSPQGLIVVSPGGVLNVTKELIHKDKWTAYVKTSTLRAARLSNSYYAFGSSRFGVFDIDAFDNNAFAQEDFSGAKNGVLIDPTSASVAFNILTSEDAIVNVMADAWSDEVFIVRDGKTWWLDIGDPAVSRDPYTWRSKKFQAEDKKNFSVMKTFFKDITWAGFTLNPTPVVDINQQLADDQYGLVRLYADDRLVWARELRVSGEQMRLPSGFKADFWQWEIEARVEVTSMQAATSVTDLRQV